MLEKISNAVRRSKIMAGSSKIQLKTVVSATRLACGRVPVGNHPNFGEVLVLAFVSVILRKHFAEHFRQIVGLPGDRGVALALLVIANRKSGAATVAELKSFDRIRGIFR